MQDNEEANVIDPDSVPAELMLETARSCRFLLDAANSAGSMDPDTREIFLRNIRKLEFFFRSAPSILDPRRIICLADRAAANPAWWRANRIRFFCRDLTYSDIAGMLGLKTHQVRDYCRKVHISTNCFDNLPEID